ncbi:MAG: helix-turn-helix transcriptional regulator [Clostridiales bacterium]|nr:helix-turn-helix transcriptional regulator [Clostridiales bacterium]
MDTLNNILELMKEKGIEQKELETNLALSRGTITKWKNGENKSYLKHINKIADYFNVSTDFLLGRNSQDDTQQSTDYEYKLISIGRMQERGITPEEDAQIAEYIEFLISQRGKKKS